MSLRHTSLYALSRTKTSFLSLFALQNTSLFRIDRLSFQLLPSHKACLYFLSPTIRSKPCVYQQSSTPSNSFATLPVGTQFLVLSGTTSQPLLPLCVLHLPHTDSLYKACLYSSLSNHQKQLSFPSVGSLTSCSGPPLIQGVAPISLSNHQRNALCLLEHSIPSMTVCATSRGSFCLAQDTSTSITCVGVLAVKFTKTTPHSKKGAAHASVGKQISK